MSELLGGNTIENAIKIDELPLSAPGLVYGRSWKEVATGDEVLDLDFPRTITKCRIVILYEEPEMVKGMQYVNKAAVSTLTKMLPVSTVEEACDMLSEKREEAVVVGGRARVY